MKVRKKGYVSRVLLWHGLLLVAVLAVMLISLQFQYRALRDQTAGEQRNELQQANRQSALLAETYLRARLAELVRRAETIKAPRVASVRNESVRSGVYGRNERRILRSLERVGPPVFTDEKALAFLSSVQDVAIGGPFTLGGGDATLLAAAVSGNEVFYTVVTGEQLGTAVLAPARQVDGRTMALFDDHGRCVAGDDPRSAGSVGADHMLTAQMDLTLSRVHELGGTGSATVGDSFFTVQAFSATQNQTWAVATVGWTKSVDERLQPLVARLVTWTALVVVAVMVVLVSTAASLIRVSRREGDLRRQMLSKDLEKARRIQLNWLPAPRMTTCNLDIAAENRPALHISGDFYNWIDLPAPDGSTDCRTAVVLGDVTGHGLPAAFLMATTQMLVRSTIQRLGDPGNCLTEVNRQLCTLVYNGQFVTMLVMVIDHVHGVIDIASAGQGPPLSRVGGRWGDMKVDSQLVLGVDESLEYVTQRLPFPVGSAMFLYTDGVTESTNDRGEQFGLLRLATALESVGSADPGELVAVVNSSLGRFAGDAFDDDLTFLALHVTGKPSQPFGRDDAAIEQASI